MVAVCLLCRGVYQVDQTGSTRGQETATQIQRRDKWSVDEVICQKSLQKLNSYKHQDGVNRFGRLPGIPLQLSRKDS